ncbi:MAG TPA: hypothetical protein VFN68_05985 [Acidimicrobiales bacterium]|nr:hypothetical protein [Acidimicrobiales bacterium]
MIVVEVVGALVLLLLVGVATGMAVMGLLGVVGAVRLSRCRCCGHLRASGLMRSPGVCLYCRHPWLVRHVMPVHLAHLLPAELIPAELTPAEPPAPGAKVAH